MRAFSYLVILSSGVLLGVMGYGQAEAHFRRHDSSFCMPRNSAALYSRSHQSGYLFNDTIAANNEARCPYQDDSLFGRNTVNGLNVHVFDGNGSANVQAQACIQWFGQQGGTCGTPSNTGVASFTGNATLTPGLSEWIAAPADWGFVHVQGGVGSRIYGYFVNAP